jgi:hypothetical protein
MAPPTKVQNFLLASLPGKKGEVDAIDDTDLGWLDDDAVNEGAKDPAARRPVGLIEVRAHDLTKAVHARQGFSQGRLFLSL